MTDRDPGYAASGTAIANIRLAVNDHRKDAQGNSTQETYWFNVVAFGKIAEVAGNYASKGSKIAVTGQLVQRNWEDSNGNKRSVIEIRANSIELLGSNAQNQGQSRSLNQNQDRSIHPPASLNRQQGYVPPPKPPGFQTPADEEIPF